jgi:hypothetical protein
MGMISIGIVSILCLMLSFQWDIFFLGCFACITLSLVITAYPPLCRSGSALGAVDIGLFTGIHSSFRSGLRSLVFLAFPALCSDALRIICAQCFPSI